jgi:hypothetical protein
MTPWDDVEVDSDGDEMLDWLWDLPDRYDVGIEDDPTAPGAVVDGAGRPGVRKRVRRPDEAAAAAAAPKAAAGPDDDRPTLAVDLAEPFDDVDYGGDTMFAPASRRESWLSRYTTRELATAAAVFLGVIALAGIGYAVTSNKGGAPKPSNLAIGSAPTTATTVAGVIATPGAATTSPTDTTVPPDTTTSTPPPTDTSVPGAFGGFTSTTVHQCIYTVAFRLPADTSTVPPTTSPPTTTPPTTTPPTTTPPTTTPPTTTPPTTTPPTTVPPTTTTTVHPTTTTTVPPTTTTTKAPTPTTAPPPPPPATTIPKLVCR